MLCVPSADPNWEQLERLEDVPAQLREEIEHFFISYKRRERKDVQSEGWEDAARAREVVEQALARHRG